MEISSKQTVDSIPGMIYLLLIATKRERDA